MSNNFIFDGCDTVQLAKEYGTPLYVISEKIIRDRCNEVKKSFLNKYKNTMAFYASKAFLNIAMCKIVEEEGLGLDVVSGGEIYTAVKAGFPMERVEFHGNNKTCEELELAISSGVGRIVVDNFYELYLIEQLAERYSKNVDILIRIIPGIDSHTHQYIDTGRKDSKFGVPAEKEIILEMINKILNTPSINLLGFHFHVGSQLFDNKSHLMAVDVVMNIIRDLYNETGFVTKELNTGGGYGIYYCEGDEPKPVSYFVDPIMEKIYAKCEECRIQVPKVMIEPGRWLIGEAGITLYTIGSIKQIPNIRKYISIDGGMTDNPRPALYQAKYEAIIANKFNESDNEVVTIAGKCCESGDIMIKDIKIPKADSGDILAVMSTGAYNYSMANNYNKIPKPAVIFTNQGDHRVVVKRESYEDMLKLEVI